MTTSRETSVLGRARSLLAMLSSANAVAAAVESGAAPRARDLKRLGIDPRAFRAIRQG